MNLFTQKVLNSIVQIILFSLVPFIWWCITARKECSFFQWIGLKTTLDAKRNKTAIWTVCTCIAFLILSVLILYMIRNIETATSEFSGLGLKVLPAIIVYAFFNTSLPEEILFRGFLLKRFACKFGFSVGNILQSALFGLLHGVMFFSFAGVLKTVIIILFTSGIGWSMGYINEKRANGSILPSWCIHAIANAFSGICTAFMLF